MRFDTVLENLLQENNSVEQLVRRYKNTNGNIGPIPAGIITDSNGKPATVDVVDKYARDWDLKDPKMIQSIKSLIQQRNTTKAPVAKPIGNSQFTDDAFRRFKASGVK